MKVATKKRYYDLNSSRTHGGARPNAGRKPIAGTAPVMKSVKLSHEHWERAKEIGNGNMAEGLRRTIDAYWRLQ